LRDEAFSISITSSLDRLVVFTPPTRDYYCVEPVSHVSNAIHMVTPESHGLASLAAGESLEAWMKIDVARP
jgi:aldose 1-epimerase